jgi:energy-coupling factor transport system permease protein
LIRRLKRLLIFFVFLALIQSIFTPGGENLVKIGSLKILTIEGLYTGISIMLRMSTIICSAMLIASIPPMDLIYGLIAMRLPYELAFMVLLAIKFLPLFKEEFKDSIIAVQLAGTDLIKIPLGEKLLLYNYILTPSVLKALNRARYISISMEYRGFRAYSDRTSYRKLKMKKADYMTILATIVLAIGIITF